MPPIESTRSLWPAGRRGLIAWAIFACAFLAYALLPAGNTSYADDSVRWAHELTRDSGLANSHHLYLNALRAAYHAIRTLLGAKLDPLRFHGLYCSLWGASGLVAFYALLRRLRMEDVALPGTLLLASTSNWWLYSIAGDVYIPATALLVAGTHSFVSALEAESSRDRWSACGRSILLYSLMILHHQAYSVFVPGIAVGSVLARGGLAPARLRTAVLVPVAAAVVALSTYAIVFHETPHPAGMEFRSFVSGYAESYEARPDQKLISVATLINSAAGEVRATLPYYVAFRSARLAAPAQARFPYRFLYPYPYLMRTLGPLRVTIVVLGIALAVVALLLLVPRGCLSAILERRIELAVLVAVVPQALFFTWWEGLSDEFWIWSLPWVALFAARGASGWGPGQRWLRVGAIGLFSATLLGAVLPYHRIDSDIDYVNHGYLAGAKRDDLVLGFDALVMKERVALTQLRVGYRYLNVLDRMETWSGSDLAAVETEASATLARGGRVLVDPYLVRPPRSYARLLELRNPRFETDRRELLDRLAALSATAVVREPLVAGDSTYFEAAPGR